MSVEKAGSRDYEATGATIDRRLPAVFLALGLILGTLYAVVMPPFQVPDEIMHFSRAYSVSQGVCVASPDINIPKSFVQLNERFPDRLEKHWKISFEDLLLALKMPLNDHDLAGDGKQRSLAGFINQNTHHCISYLPAAAVLYAGRHAALSPLALMYLCRMTNLISYVLLTFLALRLLPDFRMILFCVALMPMSLHQAASVSADATINAVSFLFVAYVFRLAFDANGGKLRILQYLILALLIGFLVLSKTLVCEVFLLLLIPAGRFPSRRARWLVMNACLLLTVACAAIWQHVNQPNIQRLTEQRSAMDIDVPGNLRFMRQHPIELALIMARSAADPRYDYGSFEGFVGTLGWLAVQLPSPLLLLYFLLFLAAALTQTRAAPLSHLARGLLLLFAVAAVVNILAACWAINVTRLVLDEPLLWAQARIPLQGRYWIPVAVPILVLFSTGRTRLNPYSFAWFAVAVTVLATSVALYMVRGAYYL